MAFPISVRIRLALVVAVIGAFFVSSTIAQHSPTTGNTRQPVLVELFTSEGCSDCPPADALLERLDSTQFAPGVEAIVLSEHVTYWNHLGWRDPFSFQAMDQRQRQYSQRLSLDEIYTPQIIVDGTQQLIGSDAAALSHALAIAASSPKQQIAIEAANRTQNSVHFTVRILPDSKATLVAALAENATHSDVARGENAGRTLHHVSVVRVLKEFDSKDADGRPLSLPEPPAFSVDKATGPLRLVVFLADRNTGRILAVAEQNINR
jgi:hypothetical protein